MRPDPSLSTADIRLRPFVVEDAPAVAAACADDAIVQFTLMEAGLTEDAARRWIARANRWWSRGHPRFAIVARNDDRLLGQIGIAVNNHHRSAEAYYWVAAGERGRGVAGDALALVAEWAFDNGVERLFLLIHPDNRASNALAARMGFTKEGVLRSYEPFKGDRPDFVSWSLLPSDVRPWRQDVHQDEERTHAATVDGIHLAVQQEPDLELVQQLIRGLVAANDRVAPPENHRRLAVFAYDGDVLVGGAYGYTHWQWLFLSHLWVAEQRRRAGVGSALMSQIEHAARERGACAAHLDTYDFQAAAFYDRQGYDVFGELADYPPGHTRYFMTKSLGPVR